MSGLLTAYATVLVATILAGLVRIEAGPTRADRMLAALLFGTSGTGLALVLAEATGERSLIDVGLTFALLGAVGAVAFVRRAWEADR